MKITIYNSDERISSHVQGNPTLTDFIATLNTVILGAMNTSLEATPEHLRSQVQQLLFEEYNYAASNLLAAFAPDIDMRPDWDPKQMMEAENAYLDKKVQNMPKM